VQAFSEMIRFISRGLNGSGLDATGEALSYAWGLDVLTGGPEVLSLIIVDAMLARW
jgi:hypothetical protein